MKRRKAVVPRSLAHGILIRIVTCVLQRHVACLLGLGFATLAWTVFALVHGHAHVAHEPHPHEQTRQKLLLPFMKHKDWIAQDQQELQRPPDHDVGADWKLPQALAAVLSRASQMRDHCTNLQSEQDFVEFEASFQVPLAGTNETVASLPSFGIVEQLEHFKYDPLGALGGRQSSSDGGGWNPADWNCVLPPETECHEQTLTVIFLAHNPDRLEKAFSQIKLLLTDTNWKRLVQEVVLVWNGARSVDESPVGQDLLHFSATAALRVVYPLRMGLANDLLNRYHPKVVQVQTKALLYYDDDGPFYSFAAVQAGFELWKRHSSSQVGAMARQLTYSPRQQREHDLLVADHPEAADRQFVSQCTNVQDELEYNYRYFANYNANMVLPSGSILHANYLCFLFHPALEPIRHFVRQHPVRPDDVTVSMIVSQLAGRAPRVYSRRLNPDTGPDETNKKKRPRKRRQRQARRRLFDQEEEDDDDDNDGTTVATDDGMDHSNATATQHHRRLMFDINWDAKGGMNRQKQVWANLRTQAVNALVQYFGSLNSGSIGWCHGSTLYHDTSVAGHCKPDMAKIGWLSWMNPDGTPKETCP